MSKKSRTKGHNFEREVALILNEAFYMADLPIKVQRDLAQYQERDRGDLVGLEDYGFVIECKRYAKGNKPLTAWWDQVTKAAEYQNAIPLLIYRFDRQQSEVQFPLMMFITEREHQPEYNEYFVRMDFDKFLHPFISYIKAKHEQ